MLNFIKKYLRIHFGFSKSESRGTLVLLSIITILVIIGTFTRLSKNNQSSKELSTEEVETLEIALSNIEKKQTEKFQLQNIKNYPRIITSLHSKTINNQESLTHKNKTQSNSNFLKKPNKSNTNVSFDINIATLDQLKKIKGIGDILSKRIIKFRDKLGGFISKSQYSEVYGLKNEVVEELSKYSFITKTFSSKKIFLNKATIKDLVSHPYIKYENAIAIVRHIEQKGIFKSKKDFAEFCEKTNLNYTKIEPYISIENS